MAPNTEQDPTGEVIPVDIYTQQESRERGNSVGQSHRTEGSRDQEQAIEQEQMQPQTKEGAQKVIFDDIKAAGPKYVPPCLHGATSQEAMQQWEYIEGAYRYRPEAVGSTAEEEDPTTLKGQAGTWDAPLTQSQSRAQEGSVPGESGPPGALTEPSASQKVPNPESCPMWALMGEDQEAPPDGGCDKSTL